MGLMTHEQCSFSLDEMNKKIWFDFEYIWKFLLKIGWEEGEVWSLGCNLYGFMTM